MNDRQFWLEINRGIGHLVKGLGTISAAIVRRWASVPGMESKQTASQR